MASKKKLLTSGIALTLAAAIGLGGTFAWQSINQTALNEASDIVNPGGRLHNDQHWVNDMVNDTDIYVENFTDPNNGGNDIFARVRLEEYMEVVMNYGVAGAETVEVIAGSKTLKDSETTGLAGDATRKDLYDYTYAVHKFTDDDKTKDFWTWTAGEKDSEDAYFIPTYNLNKDSLLADLNGEYVDTLGGISNREAAQYKYTAVTDESTAEGYEIYDGDVNTLDEVKMDDLKDLIENGTDAENYATFKDNIVLTDEKVTHDAAKIGDSNGLISMSDWIQKYRQKLYGEPAYGEADKVDMTELYNYWVYDEDGWVYWSAPIKAGTSTGRLLDSIELNHVMDDTWYYAINVTAQFVTANDVGKTNRTGFYTTKDGKGTEPSYYAEMLLEAIGVDMDGETMEQPLELTVTASPKDYYFNGNAGTNEINLTLSATYEGEDVDFDDLTNVKWEIAYPTGDLQEDTGFDSTTAETVKLTISGQETKDFRVSATASYEGETVSGDIWITNGPSGYSYIFHENGAYTYAKDYYEAGKDNGYELFFFKDRLDVTGDWDRSNAYTGTDHDYLVRDITWALVDERWEDTTIEGVELVQDTENPGKVTVKVAEGMDEVIQLGCKDDGRCFNAQILLPKADSVELNWGEYMGTAMDRAEVSDNGKTITYTPQDQGDGTFSSWGQELYPHFVKAYDADGEELTVYETESAAQHWSYSDVMASSDYTVSKESEDGDVTYTITAPDGSSTLAEIGGYSGNITIYENALDNNPGTKVTFDVTLDMAGQLFTTSVTLDIVREEKDWSSLVTMRLLTNNDYEALCDATNEDDSKMHWSTQYSWAGTDDDDSAVARGNKSARYTSNEAANAKYSNILFRPAFAAKDLSSCSGLSVGDKVLIGTIYDGSNPIKEPTDANFSTGDATRHDPNCTEPITLGAALEDAAYQIHAIYVGDGVFVCDNNLLYWVSWYELQSMVQ